MAVDETASARGKKFKQRTLDGGDAEPFPLPTSCILKDTDRLQISALKSLEEELVKRRVQGAVASPITKVLKNCRQSAALLRGAIKIFRPPCSPTIFDCLKRLES